MSEKKFENITKSDSNLEPTFVDHHVLPDIPHCLINNTCITKKVRNIYISYTPTPWLTKFKHRFYVR